MLVEAGGDSAVMLDPIEEPLDMVAQLVGPFVEGGLDGAMVERLPIRRPSTVHQHELGIS